MRESSVVREIPCRSESGKKYLVHVYQEYVDGTMSAHKSFKTADGWDVEFIDPETFRIASTHEIIKRIH